jgi:hypothetical protein
MRFTPAIAALVLATSACGGLGPRSPGGPEPLVTVHGDPAHPSDGRPDLPQPESPAQAVMFLLVSGRPPPPSLIDPHGSSPEPVQDLRLQPGEKLIK